MDQDPFTASLFKWDPRATLVSAPPPQQPNRLHDPASAGGSLPPYLARGLLGIRDCAGMQASFAMSCGGGGGGGGGGCGLEELFQAYGIRYYTAAKIAEMGFTVSTLVDMKEEELDDMMNSLSHLFRWELLVGERYGVKAAIRAERRRLEEIEELRHQRHHINYSPSPDTSHHPLDALSQEGVQEKEVVGTGGGSGGNWELMGSGGGTTAHHRKKYRKQAPGVGGSKKLGSGQNQHNMMIRKLGHHQNGRQINSSNNGDINNNNVQLFNNDGEMEEEEEEVDDDEDGGMICRGGGNGGGERQREHPFIVTEPGEVARGKKNGLDYLFHLYEQCREFLLQVQAIAKERGEKCPTKVTNQVFRYAKRAGATYINKPKMRHYVHCYALHCLDEDTSNALRKAYKERGENVGSWRLACYAPLVAIAGRIHSWDIDVIFNSHPRLSIWYVPTKLRQLCHAERSSSAPASSSISGGGGGGPDHLHHF